MDRQQAVEWIRGSPLADIAGNLLDELRPSARLLVAEEVDAGPGSPQGCSQAGGQPRLPRDFAWPRWDREGLVRSELAQWQARLQRNPQATFVREFVERLEAQLSQGPQPLAFLAQLQLSDLQSAAPLVDWPANGSLAFFYDPLQDWGFDPAARGSCRVCFFSEQTQLAPVAAPQDMRAGGVFPARHLTFERDWTLPRDLRIGDVELSTRNDEHYAALLGRLMSTSDTSEPIHRCGGHPQPIQGDMPLKCQLVTHGLYCGNAAGYRDPRRAALEAGVADWQLLAQFDTDADRLGWSWGDTGRVYFWIRRQDLAVRDFDSVWAILQCY